VSTIALRPSRRVLADAVPRSLVADAALVSGAAAFVGLLAQITIHLSWTPVPVTGQTLGVMLAGTALGWRRAALSMSLYVVAGLAGLPWFANHASGYVNANFGYLVGFIASASVLGFLAGRGSDRTVTSALGSMFIGELVVFAIAVPWLAGALHVSLSKAVALGLTPFVLGEAIKIALAGLALPSTWRLVDKAAQQ